MLRLYSLSISQQPSKILSYVSQVRIRRLANILRMPSFHLQTTMILQSLGSGKQSMKIFQIDLQTKIKVSPSVGGTTLRSMVDSINYRYLTSVNAPLGPLFRE